MFTSLPFHIIIPIMHGFAHRYSTLFTYRGEGRRGKLFPQRVAALTHSSWQKRVRGSFDKFWRNFDRSGMDMLGNDDDDDLVPVKDDLVDPEHVFNQQVSKLAPDNNLQQHSQQHK